jgi:hypothetical protein
MEELIDKIFKQYTLNIPTPHLYLANKSISDFNNEWELSDRKGSLR